eukprot:3658563-Pyramimonas_sp.AAC.1
MFTRAHPRPRRPLLPSLAVAIFCSRAARRPCHRATVSRLQCHSCCSSALTRGGREASFFTLCSS